MIVVIDYGMGNLRSVEKAFETLGAKVKVSSRPADLRRAAKLVLPGVGAFAKAMAELRARSLIRPIQEAIRQGKPFLGVCLGFQLLFTEGYEGGRCRGLGIFPGAVRRFPQGVKVPHMGWNKISRVKGQRGRGQVKSKELRVERWRDAGNNDCPLLRGIPDDAYMYFVHSYYADSKDRKIVATETSYGVRFPSMIWRDTLFATQFHPEKSQRQGLRILTNFVRI